MCSFGNAGTADAVDLKRSARRSAVMRTGSGPVGSHDGANELSICSLSLEKNRAAWIGLARARGFGASGARLRGGGDPGAVRRGRAAKSPPVA